MGVHAAGGAVHRLFRLFPRAAERFQRLRRRKHGGLPPGFYTGPKIWLQGRGAGEEGIDIHIPVAPVIHAVHQARLRRYAHFVQQGAHCIFRAEVRISTVKVLREDRLGDLLKLFHGMGAASSTDLGRFSAEQAPSRHRAIQLSAVFRQDVHVVKASKGRLLFDGAGNLFQKIRRRVHHIDPLAARGLRDLLKKDDCCFVFFQPFQKHIPSKAEPPTDERAVLKGSGDVHGKGNERQMVLLKKLLLPAGAALTGFQHHHHVCILWHRFSFDICFTSVGIFAR